MAGEATPDIAKMSFEDAIAELEAIVKKLESGQGSLDDAVAAYERGAQLKAHCERRLNEAKLKVERIRLGPDGATGSEPFDPE